ncbi:bifunctional transcriptional activator/DNA repair enzyme AdaA [Kurthia sibirica]|uniref:AraC family transcriptional regulator n=1 Tax=Kurthia sibirica TaxID=202750 RepID=A0A2U3AJD9_9BACL|nr:Ada metal-binding domain-containing protein [Kurthia sibirica]PWI24581.1 AraC family transcriptional regulator [Kurthia sibirica]GEK33534.1 bifunctional transcriptional activator/DNA repair enzyme AdaA [Kurthia sibirica]
MLGRVPTEIEWESIITNNKTVDKDFVYAVSSTKICCRPSCPSRTPKIENVRIYESVDLAIEAGYRPCKRCKPGGIRLPESEWTDQMNEYMDVHFEDHITLQFLADEFHGSPYHLQRVYKKAKGYTPTEYLQQVRIKNAIKLLEETYLSVEDVGHKVGLHNTSYFITLFKNIVGTTPKQYKIHGRK